LGDAKVGVRGGGVGSDASLLLDLLAVIVQAINISRIVLLHYTRVHTIRIGGLAMRYRGGTGKVRHSR
jgi:hypothetical protein